MFLKKITACLLVFYATIHSMEVSEETKQHMQLCYEAIKNNQVKKLHTLLAKNKFFNQYIVMSHGDNCRKYSSTYSGTPTHFCACHFNDPLQVAICEHRVSCIRLIAYLRGKVHKQFANTTFIHPCYLIDLYRHHNFYTEKELFSLTRMFLDNKIAKVDEYYTHTVPGTTPLHVAPTAAIAEYLIQQGASVDSMVNPRGVATPLIRFSDKESPKNTAILLCLLKYNANLNVKNQNGETAFHWAASHGCLHHITLLLDYGADPMIKPKPNSYHVPTTQARRCIENYPRIALIGKTFDIDPFKYSDHFEPSKYTHANTATLLRNRELTGRKHSYQGYKFKES